MNTPYSEWLEEQLDDREAEIDYLRSLLDSFWTGDIPQGATLDHMKLAKYGRKRLEDQGKVPALLAK
jgi:hypothetical protein